MHWFLKFILEWNSTCFGQFLCPPSAVIHCTLSNGICHTDSYRAAAAGLGWHCSSLPILLLLLESCLQTCMTYTIAVCTVNNCLWWTEELSETCGVQFQNKFEKSVHLVGFIIRDFEIFCAHFPGDTGEKCKISQCSRSWGRDEGRST
jgi:hypothetical protein